MEHANNFCGMLNYMRKQFSGMLISFLLRMSLNEEIAYVRKNFFLIKNYLRAREKAFDPFRTMKMSYQRRIKKTKNIDQFVAYEFNPES